MTDEAFICMGCGTQYAPTPVPPAECPVCLDDRQYVAGSGPQWATHGELAATYHNRIEHDADRLGVGIVESFAIPQRALLVPSSAGNIMWDCVSVMTDAAVEQLRQRGGVDAIALSHPHFYSAMVEWSDAFGGVPIYLHEADRSWVRRHSSSIRWWSGDELVLAPSVRLVHLPGHFPGSAALHWTSAPRDGAVLLAGDSLHVAADGRHITVMHSVPNYIPVGPAVIRDLQARLADVDFDDLYGFTWGRNLLGDARAAVDASLDRYLNIITA